MKTPYFVFKKQKLEQNYKQFEDLCKKYLENFKIAYSIKTNSEKEIIKTLLQKNSGFEIASLEEIKKIPKDKFTIFNGACKTEEEIKIAIQNNFLINADSKSEIEKISSISKKSVEIGLRISLNRSKFGFEKNKIKEIIKYAESKNMRVIGLHFHCGTKQNIKEYEKNLKEINKLIKNSGIKLKYIDIGGGLPDNFQLKNLNLKLENYFILMKKYLQEFKSTIIIEPGRVLVADTFELITKVCVIKENFGEKYAILDAGINFLPKITLANYKFSKIEQNNSKEPKQTYTLAGPLLFSNDILGKFNENLKEGDLIRVENVGAYCYNLAWEISYKKPKIISFK